MTPDSIDAVEELEERSAHAVVVLTGDPFAPLLFGMDQAPEQVARPALLDQNETKSSRFASCDSRLPGGAPPARRQPPRRLGALRRGVSLHLSSVASSCTPERGRGTSVEQLLDVEPPFRPPTLV